MTLGRTGTRTLRKWDTSTPRMTVSAVRSGKLSAEVDGKLGMSAEAAKTSTRKGIAKYDAKKVDFGMEEKSKEDEDVGNNAEELSKEVEVTKVANPFAMKAQRLHPRWPSVAACALRSHTTKTPRDSLCSVGCCCRVSVRRQPAQGQYKSQEGHHRRQDEREGRLGEGQEEGARQRQLRHRHAAGAVRGTDAASMDGDPIYVYFAYLSFSYL